MQSDRPGLWEVVRDELQPYDGRLGQTVRMTVLCMLVVAVAMTLRVPEAAVSCYLIFFAARNNAGDAIRTGLALIAAASVAILLAFVFLMLSADEPGVRLLFIALFTFAGMFFSQASKAGPIAATVGFVFAFALTLYDEIPVPELLTRGLAWLWVAVFFPMFFMIVLNVLAGANPARLLRRQLAARVAMVADIVGSSATLPATGSAMLARGNEPLIAWHRSARFLSKLDAAELERSQALIGATFDLLAVAVAARETKITWSPGEQESLLARLKRLETTIASGKPLVVDSASHTMVSVALGKREVDDGIRALERIATPDFTSPEGTESEQAKEPFLAPDAFTNPLYTQFALKSLLAVMVCYLTYTSLHWFEIHTAMVTGYYVALGTTGETIHKLTLRIAGALIGAVMGMGSILFLIPHMSDIGHLLLLVGAGTFVSAWVANGSKRIQYIGWQMALCFFLTVLHGFGPGTDLGVASSRVIGILFGNLVITVVFTYLWPVGIASAVGKSLSGALSTLSNMLNTARPATTDLRSFYPQMEVAERSHELHVFELERSPDEKARHDTHERLNRDVRELASPILLLTTVGHQPQPPEQNLPRTVLQAFTQFRTSVASLLHNLSSAAINGQPGRYAVAAPDAYARLRKSVAEAWRTDPTRFGSARAEINAELNARLSLCKRIDTQLARVAAEWK